MTLHGWAGLRGNLRWTMAWGGILMLFLMIQPPTARAAAPVAPSGLVVTPMSASHFQLTWTDQATDEDGYLIRYSTDGTTYKAWGNFPANTTQAEFRGPLGSTLYYFKVSAYKTGVGSSDSAAVSAVSEANPGFSKATVLSSVYNRLSMNMMYESTDGYTIAWGDYKPNGTGDNAATYAYTRASSDGGVTWSAPDRFWTDATWSIKSFHFVKAGDGSLIAIVTKEKAGSSPREAQTGFLRFPPNGTLAHTKANLTNITNWSPYERFTDASHYYQHAQPRLVVLSNGDLIVPLLAGDGYFDAGNGVGAVIYKLAAADVASPSGQWYSVTPTRITDGSSNRSRFAEPSLVEYGAGQLLCYGRTEQGFYYEVRSADYGESWSGTTAARTRIVAPTAPPYLTKVPGSGDIALLWNPRYNAAESLGGKRLTLTSVISSDGGLTWRNFKEIEYNLNADEWNMYPVISYNVGGKHWLMFAKQTPSSGHWAEKVYSFQPSLFETPGVLNPGFENGTAHWTVTRNAAATASVKYSGASGLMIGDGQAGGGLYQTIETKGGVSYTFSAYAKVSHAADRIKIQAKDAVTGADLGTTETSSTSFTKLSVTFTAPAAHPVKLIIWKYTGGTTAAVYADQVSLE